VIGGAQGCEAAPSNVPVTLHSIEKKLNTFYRKNGGRHHMLWLDGVYHLVDLRATKRQTAAEVETLARKHGVIEPFETVMPE
jgi:hypothetical protein